DRHLVPVLQVSSRSLKTADLLAVHVHVHVVVHPPRLVTHQAPQSLEAALENVQQLLDIGSVYVDTRLVPRRTPEGRRAVLACGHAPLSSPAAHRSAPSSGTLRSRSPVSQSTVTIVRPAPRRSATPRAAHTFAPAEMPTRRPSSRASRRAIAIASSS